MAFVIRTEEISLDEILDLYVPTEGDASILDCIGW